MTDKNEEIMTAKCPVCHKKRPTAEQIPLLAGLPRCRVALRDLREWIREYRAMTPASIYSICPECSSIGNDPDNTRYRIRRRKYMQAIGIEITI